MLSFFQKFKYSGFINFYNDSFKLNYNNVLFILKCYNNIKNNKNNHLLDWQSFLYRQRDIFKYNFFYRVYKSKKNIFYYNYFYNKKLSLIRSLGLTSKPNYFFTSYLNDSSLLFYDKVLNLNYTDHIDEKYSFYLKNLLFSKISNRMRSKFNGFY